MIAPAVLEQLRRNTAQHVADVALSVPHIEGRPFVHSTAAAIFLEVAPNYVGIRRTRAHIEDAARDRLLRERSRSVDQDVSHDRAQYRDAMALLTDADMETSAARRKRLATRPVNSTRGKIVGWSRRSRARMTRTLNQLDWTPLFESGRTPIMLTLTLPGDWQTLAPTPARYRKLIENFKVYYYNAWGEGIMGSWKLEYQRRGAPHLHVIMTPPEGTARSRHAVEFPQWASMVWADIVGSEDPVEKAKHLLHGVHIREVEPDAAHPSTIGSYFSKHGMYSEKDYQNEMPRLWRDAIAEGEAGIQFWGTWQLKKALVAVQLSDVGAATIESILDPLGAGRVIRSIIGEMLL